MKSTIYWACKTVESDEAGPSDPVFTAARETRWDSIIEQFSKRYFINDTDRLTALEGLAREHQKMRDDSCCLSGGGILVVGIHRG